MKGSRFRNYRGWSMTGDGLVAAVGQRGGECRAPIVVSTDPFETGVLGTRASV